MNPLQPVCQEIRDILSDKGYVRVKAWFSVDIDSISAFIDYYLDSSDSYEQRKTVPGYQIESLETLLAAVRAVPPRLDLARQEFLKRLASLVETAEALELNIPELRPLFEDYRNNLLEHHK